MKGLIMKVFNDMNVYVNFSLSDKGLVEVVFGKQEALESTHQHSTSQWSYIGNYI